MSVTPISVVIPTLDEESQIGPCLDSVAWAQERLVVDSGSSDATCPLARQAGARVLEHPFEGYGAQKNWAAGQARHDWILQLDADERVTPGLRDEILALSKTGFDDDAYSIRRASYFAGRLIRHGGWQRDRVVRLYDRRQGRFSLRLVHERLETRGSLGRLRQPMEHHTYRSLPHYLAKTARYAEAGASQLLREGRQAGLWKLVFAPLGRFLRMYVLQAGFLDGSEGFLLASIASWGVFQRYAILRELAANPDCLEPGSLPSWARDARPAESGARPSEGEPWR